MIKLTITNVFVLSLSTEACHPHFIASWGCALYFFKCFLLRCWLCKILIFILLTLFARLVFLKVNVLSAACTRLICVFWCNSTSWQSDIYMLNMPVLQLLWCAIGFQRMRYLPLLVVNRLCVLCLRISYKQVGSCFFLTW